MKVLMINSVCGIRSTGRICTDLADVLMNNGHECRIAYAREQVPAQYEDIAYRIGSSIDYIVHGLKSRVAGYTAFYSNRATLSFLKWVDDYSPDIIHLHNLHGYYINVEMLFDYIRSHNIPVVWTLHDCWAFTGHCSHYSLKNCYKWKDGCHDCSMTHSYPRCLRHYDTSYNFIRKKECFSNIKNMVIVTPSEWLAEQVRESFLCCYPIRPIFNGVDLDVFNYRESTFRHEYSLDNYFMVLGVATAWGKNKGLDDFIELSTKLEDRYKVVLVGLTDKQRREVPSSVIALNRTNDSYRLAEIYSSANVFLNLSYQETMGLVTVESMACGTPVITYDQTAVPEVVDSTCGIVVHAGDIDAVVDAIHLIDGDNPFSMKSCINHSKEFDKLSQYQKYLHLYEEIME